MAKKGSKFNYYNYEFKKMVVEDCFTPCLYRHPTLF